MDRIGNDVEAAGFPDVSITTSETVSNAPSARHPAIACRQGTPLRNEIEPRDAGLVDAVIDQAVAAISARCGTGSVSAKIQAHVVTAGA